MVESKVTRIGGTYFARIPAGEARRLGLHENDAIDLVVRPVHRGARDVLLLKGSFKGAFRRDTDLWSDG